jgi:hypothetical protein
MVEIGIVSNGERAESARVKLNQTIERVNQIGNLSAMLSSVSQALGNMNALMVASQQELQLMRSLSSTIQSQGYISANAMELYYPRYISIRQNVPQRIEVRLYPTYALQNVLYLPAGGDSLEVFPDGRLSVRSLGTTKIHVIPPGRTKLYKTIEITVRQPYLRKSSNGLRLTQSGNLRIL